jgi:hypothetical protein
MTLLSNDRTRRIVGGALALGFAIVLSGCASTGGSTKAQPKPAEKTAPAPAAVEKPVPAAPAPTSAPTTTSADKGSVVFFRDSKFMGAAVSFKVREGEQELGKLSNGSYFVAQVPAGPHAFTVHSEAKDVLNLEVEPGETYYVQGSISMGVMVGRPNLSPSDEATFAGLKEKLKDSANKEKPKASTTSKKKKK